MADHRFPLLLATAALFFAATEARAQLAIVAGSWDVPEVREFTTPPVGANGKALIAEDADALAMGEISFTQDASYDRRPGPADGSAVTLRKLKITISGRTTIHLPRGSGPLLRNHELGHDQLYQYEYRRFIAEANGNGLAQKLIGRTFPSKARAEAAIDNMVKEELAIPLQRRMARSGAIYDGLTNHGENIRPDWETAVALTKEAAATPAEDQKRREAGAAKPAP